MTLINILKIKEGKLDQLKDWCLQLGTTLKEGALESLSEEQVDQEGCFLFSINGEHYVAGYMHSPTEILPATDSELNRKHKQMKAECLEKFEGGKGTPLYFLETN